MYLQHQDIVITNEIVNEGFPVHKICYKLCAIFRMKPNISFGKTLFNGLCIFDCRRIITQINKQSYKPFNIAIVLIRKLKDTCLGAKLHAN